MYGRDRPNCLFIYFVKRDENLIDIETDKVVLELPAAADGVITKILKEDGATVKADEVIAHIDTDKKSLFVSNKKTEQKLRDLFKK